MTAVLPAIMKGRLSAGRTSVISRQMDSSPQVPKGAAADPPRRRWPTVPLVPSANATFKLPEPGSEAELAPFLDLVAPTLARIGPTGFQTFSGWPIPFSMVLDEFGGPIFWGGTNGAGAYLLRDSDGDKFVAKVLVGTDRDRLREPYVQMQELLAQHPELERYFCESQVLPMGLRVDLPAPVRGTPFMTYRFDVVRMRHVELPTLNQFIRSQKDTPQGRRRLRAFARNFRRMIAAFHAAGVVHGDYNCGNIMVTEDDQPLLIDLDTLGWRSYEPALKMAGRGEFQPYFRFEQPDAFRTHPQHIDFFSEWVIYASLVAFTESSKEAVSTQRLFFSADDFVPWSEGEVFRALGAMQQPVLTTLVRALHECTAGRLQARDMPPLERLCPAEWFEQWESRGQSSPTVPIGPTPQADSSRPITLKFRIKPTE